MTDDTDSTTDASANAGAGSGVADAAAGEQTTANKSEATDGAAAEESKSDAVTEESKSDAGHGTGAEESKADAVHGSNAGGSSVVGAGSVDIDESTGAAVEIEETKPAELLEEETKLATESEIPKEEDEKKLEEKENRKTIYIAFGKGIKVTATLEDANAVPDDARLRVTEIEDGELYDAYIAAMDEAEPEIKHTKDNTDIRDIAFIMKDKDGEETEYEPTEGSVKVAIEYLGNNLKKRLGVDDIAEVKTYHLPLAEGVKAEGEKTIDVKNVKASDINVQELDSDVKTEKKVEVEVDSFSAVVMAKEETETNKGIDLNTAVKSVSVITIGGKPFTPGDEYSRTAKIVFDMTYEFPENNKPTADGVKTATYKLPEVLDTDDASGPIICEEYSKTKPAGEYVIKKGVVTFTYYEEFLRMKPDKIKGTFSFESKLSKKDINDKKEVPITFGGSGTTITIKLEEEKEEVKAEKKYNLNEDGSIDFTIKLTVKGKAVQDLVLTDTQGSNLSFADSPEFKLDGNDIDSSNINIDGQIATIKISTLAIGEHTLSYKARLKDKKNTNSDDNTNIALVKWSGEDEGKKTEVKVKSDEKLEKKGEVNGKIITWRVTYVPGKWGCVAGETFTDTLGEGQQYYGDYNVYYSPDEKDVPEDDAHRILSGGKGALPTDGTPFKYTFSSEQTATKGAYKIVYQTEITRNLGLSKETFINEIKREGGKTATGKVDVGQKIDIVKKSGVADSDNRTATWTVTITPPEGKTLKNLVLKDELDGYNWKCHYIESSIQVKEGSTSLKCGEDYTVNFGYSETTKDNPTMTVTFNKDVAKAINITYQADYKATNKYDWTSNQVHSSYTIDSKTYEEDDSASVQFVKKDKTFSVNKEGEISDGIATWKIGINEKENYKRVELPPDIALDEIVDTLPEGMEYVDKSIKCYIDSQHYNGTLKKHEKVDAKFDPISRKLTICIKDFDILKTDRYVYIKLEYKTKLTSIPTTSQNGTVVSGNEVIFSNKVLVGGMEATADVTLKNKVLDKQGKKAEGIPNVIDYKLGVNYGAADLLPGRDTLELTDTLDANMTLDTGSIKVKDMYSGDAVVHKVSFGTTLNGENTMTLTIPDNRALLVTYKASLVSAGKVDNKNYTVTNKASLTGTQTVETQKVIEVKYQKPSATVEGTAHSITIKKVDEQGKSLSGATFVVQKVEPSNLKNDGEPQTITTNDFGTAKFTGLSYNTLYYYQETKAPSGYQKDDTKHYFIIKDAENETEFDQSKIKEGTTYGTYPDGLTINVENKKIPVVGSLEFTKSITGYKVKPADEEKITFTVTGPEGYTNTIHLKDMKDGNTYKKKLTGLKPGEYTITESKNDISGYDCKVTYKVGDKTSEGARATVDVAAGATPSTVAITNTYTQQLGSLEFAKSITGYEVKPENEEAITFTVTGPEGYTNTIHLKDMKDGNTYKKKLTGLKPGEYTITESKNDISGYDCKVTYKVGDKTSEGARATVDVAAGATPSTVAITNTYTQQLGSLEFTKSITGYEVKSADEEKITFTVAGPDYSKIIKLSEMKQGDGTYKSTLTGLKPGEYTITESGNSISGYDCKVTYTVGGKETEGAAATVNVAAGTTPSMATITNKYDANEHPVVISKTDAGGSELEGAVLELTDATGALVDKWTSTTTARAFELKPGTYKFHEVSAPSGYLVADDITFTVTIDGMITVDGKTVDKVVMIDRKKPEETTVPETTPAETTPAETTVPETTPAETTTPSGGGGGGGNHPHPLPETTPAETTPAETTVPETTPVETTNPGGGHGGPSEEVETDEYGRVRGANRGKNKKGQDGGNVKGASRGKTRTGDESMMSIFSFGFLAAVLVLLGWFGIRFTKRNRR